MTEARLAACFFMTGTNFTSLIRNYTRTNATTLPDSEILLLSNVVKDDFAKEILKRDEGLFGVLATRNLVASNSSDVTKREYSLPEDYLGMESAEAKLDGTNWIHLFEFDLTKHRRPTDETTITSYYSNNEGEAFYDIFRKSLWIYSGAITATTAGLKLHYIAYPADLVTADLSGTTDLSLDPTSTTSQTPRQFHELWARKVSIIWKSTREKPIPLSERELAFDKDFKAALAAITNPNKGKDNTATLPDDTKYQY